MNGDDLEVSFESYLNKSIDEADEIISTGNTDVYTDGGSRHGDGTGQVCLMNQESGRWTCGHYYKRDKLQAEIDNATGDKSGVILDTLQKMNITCYIVQHDSPNMMQDLRKIVYKVAQETASNQEFNPQHQRCCFFQDHEGRLFNLMIANHAVGPASYWASLLETFSGTQAMIAFYVLCRSFPCAAQDNIGQLRPAYLSLILGLVLMEEISLPWLNASMLVRGLPSVSAHTMTTRVGSDWLRKIMTLLLALSGAATGTVQKYMTLTGISLACILLLANLGSRSWKLMKLRFPYAGPLAPLLGFLAAIVAGIALPYMGAKEIEGGGKRGVEAVMISAVTVAVLFFLSDIDEVQKLVVVGSEACPQDAVNFIVGIHWYLTVFASLFMVARMAPIRPFPGDDEHILQESQASPVGYKVPQLPDHVVDPNLVKQGIPYLSFPAELLLAALVSLGVGGALVYTAFTSVDDGITGNSSEASIGSIFEKL
jgi:hypothetical protein